MKKILISAATSAVSYSIIKNLRKKYYVFGIDSNKASFKFGKSYCDKFQISPKTTDRKYLSFIKKLLTKVDIFIPFIDEELKILSFNKKKLKKVYHKILISEVNSIRLCNDKLLFNDFCIKKNILTPKLVSFGNAVIKPRIGRGGKNIIITKDKKIINSFIGKKKYIIQKFIKGKEFSVDVLYSKDSKIKNIVCRERVSKSNVSLIGKIIEDKKIINFISQISKHFFFKYLINYQIIKNKNKLYLIEINPRISGSIIFANYSGNNLLMQAVDIFLNKKIKNKLYNNITIYRHYMERVFEK